MDICIICFIGYYSCISISTFTTEGMVHMQPFKYESIRPVYLDHPNYLWAAVYEWFDFF